MGLSDRGNSPTRPQPTDRGSTATGSGAQPRTGEGVRLIAAIGVVAIAALAVATLLRPKAGYTHTPPMLIAIAAGAGLGAASLLLVGLVICIVVRDGARRRTLRHAVTAWPTMTIVLIVFVGGAAGPRMARAVDVLVGGAGSSQAAERTDFSRWQQTVAPVTAKYISAIRKDGVFLRGLPRTLERGLPATLRDSARTLTHLHRLIADRAARLALNPELKRLTESLEQGLVSAERAQRPFLLVAEGLRRGADSAAARGKLRQLRGQGLGQLQRAQNAMQTFSLGANKLGASLFAQSPG